MTCTLPEAFCARMRRDMKEEEYQAFLSSWGQERSFSLRINPLKCDRDRFLQLEWDGSPPFRPVPWEPDGFYYPVQLRPGRHPRHEAGMYYIQEASAMAPAVLCGVRPGDRVLDLCAAPGGKSTKLAACLRGRGILVANEIHPERAKVLSANLERMGVRNALVTNESPQKLAAHFPLFFDRIVVDAPCSGEGMFRKEEEALSQWSPENVQMCAERQSQILEEAAAMLRPGGRMVYSTCTFSPQENEGVIFRFLIGHPEFSLIDGRQTPDLPAFFRGTRSDGRQIPDRASFSRGRPEWLAQAGIDSDLYGEAGARAAESLRGAIRLWPHLLEGEGHFAVLLEKKGPQGRMQGQDPFPEGEDAENVPENARTWENALENAQTGENVPENARTGENVRIGKDRYTPACERGEGRRKRKKDRRAKRRSGDDEPHREAVSLWKDFARDNLLSCDPCDRPDAVLRMREERLCLFGNALWGLPEGISPGTLEGLRVLRAGLQLGRVVRGRFEPAHSLGMALGREEARRSAELAGNSPEAGAWLRGEALPVSEGTDSGWTLVQIDGCSAGWGKVSGGMCKNHYPRGLRKGSGYR